MAELQKVDDWLSALLANLEPAARSRMMRQLAQELRRTQQQNIRMQRNPDGSSYEPRRVTARSKKGRIKRQMFTKTSHHKIPENRRQRGFCQRAV
ncbi:phage virion morphogenesis protein [Escherichia coli]|uniref:Phage virion morphogenesis protein n=1 Tax=Escherichia coli TaxID=562 RepID=A0A376D3S7_ECOLX|nr:phage virion morphogenesis protein [Escherichia coli]